MSEAFLDVEKSLTGKKWIGPNQNVSRLAEGLSQSQGISSLLANILIKRGAPKENIQTYLLPKLRNLIPNPSILKDMDTAIERVIIAVQNNEKVAIFADYDVDGGASAALMYHWFIHFKLQPTIYVPDRIKEGYGPNLKAMTELSKEHDLIICVDCGTVSFIPIEAATRNNCDIIIVDHHLSGTQLPKAIATVNPNRYDEDTELKYLCAAGVLFLMLVGLNRAMKKLAIQGPELIALTDLVALATIADVASLKGLNRAFVRTGLQIMATRNRPGLVALSDVSGMRAAPRANDLGFVLGPRINAGGRIGQADLGVRLLIENDMSKANSIASELNDLNSQRKLIETQMTLEAIEQIESRTQTSTLIWAAQKGWSPGLIGIVASRMKEKFNKPSMIIAIDNYGLGKGSGRSIEGIDLGSIVGQLEEERIIDQGGGHKLAAGITLKESNIEKALIRLSDLISEQGNNNQPSHSLEVDGLLTSNSATVDLIEDIDQAGPFGAGMPGPRIAFADCRVRYATIIGESHLKLTLSDGNGAYIQGIYFRAFENEIGEQLINAKDQLFHFVGKLEVDEWTGQKKSKFIIEDVAVSN